MANPTQLTPGTEPLHHVIPRPLAAGFLIEPHWKEEGIKNFEKAKKYLDSYPFSSYLSYCGKTRKEDTICRKRISRLFFTKT